MLGRLSNGLYRLDCFLHRRGVHASWLCDLSDITCGMDQTSMSFRHTRLNHLVDWLYNSESRARHPLRWRRHDRGQHWTQTWWRRDGLGSDYYTFNGYKRVLAVWGAQPGMVRRPMRKYVVCRLCEWSVCP